MSAFRRPSVGSILVVLPAALSTAQVAYAPAAHFPVGVAGDDPRSVVVGDLNADGRPDVVTANHQASSGTVAWLTAKAGGGFNGQAKVNIASPLAVAIVDLTKEGKPAVPVLVPAGWSLVHGFSAGFFSAATPLAYPEAVFTSQSSGDFDSDGSADLVGTATMLSKLYVIPGGAPGISFGPASHVSVNGGLVSVVAGDLDLDGRLDLVTANASGASVAALLGNGSGGFAAPSYTALALSPDQIVLADLDHDGRLDCQTLHASVSTCGTALGDGSGAFAPSSNHALPAAPQRLAFGDMNRDGSVDLVSAHAGGFVGVRVANGLGGFASALTFATGANARALALADLDADGQQDIVATDSAAGSGSASVLLSTLATPAGLFAYGNGTAGCGGLVSLLASGTPQVGTANFVLSGTNAPALAHGITVLASAANLAGSDSLGLGVWVHFALVPPLFTLGASSDAIGAAATPIAIPSSGGLVGQAVHAQTFWLWPAASACDPSPLGWSSSNGLELTFQP